VDIAVWERPEVPKGGVWWVQHWGEDLIAKEGCLVYTAAGKGVKHYHKGGALTSERRPTTRGLVTTPVREGV